MKLFIGKIRAIKKGEFSVLVSIVVPCYNEEQVLKKFHEEVSLTMAYEDCDFQIVMVNDGSKDKTIDIIKDLSSMDNRVKYVSFSRNFGKEAAMLAGLKISEGDAVIIMDADLQHPPTLLPKMIQGFFEGYDQVIAKRDRVGDSPVRSLISKSYYKLMNRYVDINLTDGVGDFRLLSRKAVDALLTLSEYNRFSKGLFSWIGFKSKIIEYENVVRSGGESKWSLSSLLNYGIDGVISFNNKPLRLSIYLGLLVTLSGLLYIFSSFLNIMINGIDEPGYFTLIASILLFGGIQLFFLGIIGEYIGRIYYETKRRPHFIIEEHNIKERGYLQENNLLQREQW